MGVPEVAQGVGLQEAAADLPVQLHGLLEPCDGRAVVSEVVVRVADAVLRGRLTVAVADLLVQGDDLLAVVQRPLEITEQDVRPADLVQDAGLAAAVAVGAVQRPGVGVVVERDVVPLRLVGLVGEGAPGAGLAEGVARLPEEVQGPAEEPERLVRVPEAGVVEALAAPPC